MTIVAFALLVVLLALVCWYPPIAVFTLAMTSIAGDGFGLNNYLRVIGLQSLAIGVNGPIVIASIICCYRILADRTGQFGSRAKSLIGAVLAIAVWIPFSVLAKGGSVAFALGNLMYTGIVVVPIAIAYARKPVARAVFVGLILTQLALAVLVVLAPGSPVGALQGTQYETGLGDLAGVSQEFNGQVSRASDQPRMFAQFNDPDTYGLYAVAGLALGFFLLLRASSLWHRALGVALLSLAVFGWVATFSRGATLGLLVGVLLVTAGQVISRRVSTGGVLATAVVVLGILAFAAIKIDMVRHALQDLSLVSVSSEDVNVRLDAARVGWQGVIDSPVFGVPLDFIWPKGIPPHQLPLYFAAQYGVLPSLMICLLLWAVLGTTRRFLLSRIPLTAQWDVALAVIMGWILLGTATTNNLSASALIWVLWAVAATPWITEPRPVTYAAGMRQRAARRNLRGGRRLSALVRRNTG